jgi:rabenosyn-5
MLNYFQSLPKPKRLSAQPASPAPASQELDPDSELAHVLQPLLEQEALLESFVEEAKAQRKFEDAKTLKINLGEIRAEIDRIFKNADVDREMQGGKGKAKGRNGR